MRKVAICYDICDSRTALFSGERCILRRVQFLPVAKMNVQCQNTAQHIFEDIDYVVVRNHWKAWLWS